MPRVSLLLPSLLVTTDAFLPERKLGAEGKVSNAELPTKIVSVTTENCLLFTPATFASSVVISSFEQVITECTKCK